VKWLSGGPTDAKNGWGGEKEEKRGEGASKAKELSPFASEIENSAGEGLEKLGQNAEEKGKHQATITPQYYKLKRE